MSGKNLLVVTYHFPPIATAGVYRIVGLIKYLQDSGWSVTVMTVNRSSHERTDDSTLGLIPDGVTVIRTPSPEPAGRIHSISRKRRRDEPGNGQAGPGVAGEEPAPPRSWRSRIVRFAKTPLRWIYKALCYPDMQVGWIPVVAYRTARFVASHPGTVVFSSTPPHSTQLGVCLARVFRRFRWIADFRDPWTAPLRQPKGRLNLSFQRMLERWVLGRCDHVIANTPGNRDALLNAFPGLDDDRLTAVTNAFDDGEPVATPVDTEGLLECDIAYFGELYPDMLDVYLGAAGELRRRGARVPRLHVFGIVGDADVERVRTAGFDDRIVFQGTVPYARSISLMRGARSLLLLLPDLPRWATCVPSKLYAYLFAGPRILAIAPAGDAARIVTETGRGTAVSPDDPCVVADEIERFVSALEQEQTTAFEAVRLDPYRMASIAGRIDEILRGGGERR